MDLKSNYFELKQMELTIPEVKEAIKDLDRFMGHFLEVLAKYEPSKCPNCNCQVWDKEGKRFCWECQEYVTPVFTGNSFDLNEN